MFSLKNFHQINNFTKMFNLHIFLTISLLSLTACIVDFPKNINILDSEKSNISRIEEMNDLEEIDKHIFEKKENTIIVFYAEWCHHW
jgi:hypothetical protein